MERHESQELRFGFGLNWRSFVEQSITPQRIATSAQGLRRLLGVENLCGRTFLDIGCGSGLSSLAACLLGAHQVIAFDYDDNSVLAAEQLRRRTHIAPKRWQIQQGSVLDLSFMASLPDADIVYSWGVLHHTGAMWQALDAAVQKVRPGGLLAIAIYNYVEREPGGSATWLRIKRIYNQVPLPVQRAMEFGYVGTFALLSVLAGQNPIRNIHQYTRTSLRGMDFMHDVRDWLGGLPFEYATAGELFRYLYTHHHLSLVYLNTHDGHGCNELTFRKH